MAKFRQPAGGSKPDRFILDPIHHMPELNTFDSDAIIADLNDRGAKIVIAQHPRRAKPMPIDGELCKRRHLIENYFCKLNEFKRIAVRTDKTDQSFSATIDLAAALINSRSIPADPRPA